MRLAFIALTAALLLTGATSVQAQDAAGTTGTSSAAADQSAPAPGQVTIQPGISPKLRKKLLQDLLNAIAPPRPTAAAPAPAQTPDPPIVTTQPAATAAGTPGVVTVTPVPPRPRPATGVVPPHATVAPAAPRPAATTVPRPRPIVEPTRPAPARPAPQAAPVAPIEPSPIPPTVAAPVEPAPAIEPPIAAAPTPVAVEPEPTRSIFGAGIWLLLGLLAAAAAAVAVMHWQRTRRIARTRAALALKPRIDLSAGASSTPGLSFSGPPLAIRARLAVSG